MREICIQKLNARGITNKDQEISNQRKTNLSCLALSSIKRKSLPSWSFQVSEAEFFHHSENPLYFQKERLKSRGRNIVILKEVCWLWFRKRLGLHCPGRYRVRLRLYVDENTYWNPQCEPLVMSVNKVEVSNLGTVTNVTPLISIKFPPSVWSEIKSGRFNSNQKVVTDKTSKNWYFIYLDPFEIWFEEELEFEFKETSGYWKMGMKWDSIELFLLDNLQSGKFIKSSYQICFQYILIFYANH